MGQYPHQGADRWGLAKSPQSVYNVLQASRRKGQWRKRWWWMICRHHLHESIQSGESGLRGDQLS